MSFNYFSVKCVIDVILNHIKMNPFRLINIEYIKTFQNISFLCDFVLYSSNFHSVSVILAFCSIQKRHALTFCEDSSNFQFSPFHAFLDDVCTKTTLA